MGLAASQCRLLFITQRQNDVSAKMQKISNDRLVLARDEDDVYTKYNRMLNATKYVNADGSDLSYNAIMGPVAAQNGITSVIQNGYGQVVLNSSIAGKLNLPKTEGTGAEFKAIYPNPEALVNKMESDAEIASAVIDKIRGTSELEGTPGTEQQPGNVQSDWRNFFNSADLGNYNFKERKFSLNTLFSGYNTTSKSDLGVKIKGSDFDNFALGNHVSVSGSSVKVIRYAGNTGETQGGNGRIVNLQYDNVTFGELYGSAGSAEGMIFLGGVHDSANDSDARSNGPNESACNVAKSGLQQFGNGISAQLVAALVKNGGYKESEVASIVEKANNEVYSNYSSNIKWNKDFWNDRAGDDDNSTKYNEGAIGSCMLGAYDTKGILAKYANNDDQWVFCVNAGSYVKDLVDKVLNSLSGGNYDQSGTTQGSAVMKTTEYTFYSTNDKGYSKMEYDTKLEKLYHQFAAEKQGIEKPVIPERRDYESIIEYVRALREYSVNMANYNQTSLDNFSLEDARNLVLGGSQTSSSSSSVTAPMLGTDSYNENLANYYKNLWTQLSSNGWTTQTNETIQSSLNQGLYYIGGTKISEQYEAVSDQDAKDAAKTWYDNETRKIKRKEDEMDTKLTKYQTEYSALTKDYDSVKSIIDANVQKSFTYCQNG